MICILIRRRRTLILPPELQRHSDELGTCFDHLWVTICVLFIYIHIHNVIESIGLFQSYTTALISVSLALSRFALREHGYGASASRGVRVCAQFSLAFLAPTHGGMTIG